MILVDTSVWVEHLRRSSEALVGLLHQGRVATHPFVVGEVTLGGASRTIIEGLRQLPETVVARDDEVLSLIARRKLVGRSIGYLDAHLLASALITGNTEVWTLDKSLRAVAIDLGVAGDPLN